MFLLLFSVYLWWLLLCVAVIFWDALFLIGFYLCSYSLVMWSEHIEGILRMPEVEVFTMGFYFICLVACCVGLRFWFVNFVIQVP